MIETQKEIVRCLRNTINLIRNMTRQCIKGLVGPTDMANGQHAEYSLERLLTLLIKIIGTTKKLKVKKLNILL